MNNYNKNLPLRMDDKMETRGGLRARKGAHQGGMCAPIGYSYKNCKSRNLMKIKPQSH